MIASPPNSRSPKTLDPTVEGCVGWVSAHFHCCLLLHWSPPGTALTRVTHSGAIRGGDGLGESAFPPFPAAALPALITSCWVSRHHAGELLACDHRQQGQKCQFPPPPPASAGSTSHVMGHTLKRLLSQSEAYNISGGGCDISGWHPSASIMPPFHTAFLNPKVTAKVISVVWPRLLADG